MFAFIYYCIHNIDTPQCSEAEQCVYIQSSPRLLSLQDDPAEVGQLRFPYYDEIIIMYNINKYSKIMLCIYDSNFSEFLMRSPAASLVCGGVQLDECDANIDILFIFFIITDRDGFNLIHTYYVLG